MTQFVIVREYPHPVEKVWRVMTDPDLMPLWTSTGQGGRAEGFLPVVGTSFRFVAKPTPGWRGFVDCEVLAVDPPHRLRFSWIGDENGKASFVSYCLDPLPAGTRLTYEHTGFTGVGGFFMSKLLGSVRRKMLTVGLPAALDAVDDEGRIRSAVDVNPKPEG